MLIYGRHVNRAALNALHRRELIQRARSLGIERPEVLTRDELIDEQLRLSQAAAAESRGSGAASVRGWFGVARDLLAGLVEQGLHLPDAAKVIRGEGGQAASSARRPVATVTLAEIYAAQGHVSRGVSVLQEVLEKEPEHEVARRLLGELGAKQDAAALADAPTPTLRTPELRATDAAATARRHLGAPVDEIHVENKATEPALHSPLAVERETQVGPDSCMLFVSESRVIISWNLSEDSFGRLRSAQPLGSPVVRVVSWRPGLPAQRSQREISITQSTGELLIELEQQGIEPYGAALHSAELQGAELQGADAVVRGALGWRVPGGDSDFRVVATAVVAPLANAGAMAWPIFRPHVAAPIGDLESRRAAAQTLLERYA